MSLTVRSLALCTLIFGVAAALAAENDAIAELRRAAEQGDAKAQLNLGMMYYFGKVVPQDYSKTIQWFRRAADQGFAMAQLNLGGMYYKGQGVPQDYVAAHMFFNLAAANGYEDARKWRDELAAKMTAAQIAAAQRRAREWQEKPRPDGP